MGTAPTSPDIEIWNRVVLGALLLFLEAGISLNESARSEKKQPFSNHKNGMYHTLQGCIQVVAKLVFCDISQEWLIAKHILAPCIIPFILHDGEKCPAPNRGPAFCPASARQLWLLDTVSHAFAGQRSLYRRRGTHGPWPPCRFGGTPSCYRAFCSP